MCDKLSNDPSCKRCGGTGVVLKPNGEPPDECDCKRDRQPDDALSCSAPATGSVSQELRDAWRSFHTEMMRGQKTLDELGLKIIDENFWDLLA